MDRGLDGWRILNDVVDRVNGKGNIKVNYLGGTHELIMYRALKKRKPGEWIDQWSDWMLNGGWVIESELDLLEDKAEEVIVSSLKNPKTTFATLKSEITETLYPFINDLTGRKPIILPVILDIKREQ